MTTDVVVIGSLNFDISVVAPRHPLPGETIIGSGHFSGPGGKGANQAVAAARLGADVAMVGRVGDDPHGRALIEALRREGVDVAPIRVDDEAETGLALITIEEGGENTIVVSPGANMRVSPDDLAANEKLIAEAAIVLGQLEVPVEVIELAGRMATGTLILNPAPAMALPPGLMDRVDVLVPNRTELALLSGQEVVEVEDAVSAVRAMGRSGATVVTLGREGAILIDGDEVTVVPPFDVEAVDATGAGDTFCGALAHSLSLERSPAEAVQWANAAAALAVTSRGAQTAMPKREEVEALLAR